MLVIEREGPEALWDELLLQPSPPRSVRFVAEAEAEAEALRSGPGAPAWARDGYVVAAAGGAAAAALRIAAADGRVAALLLVDPVAAPVELPEAVSLLIVRSGDRADDGIALPDGADRAAAVSHVRAALGAPPFVRPADR
ncbi:hypothetical protein [Amnibacterium kyonggiense]